MDSEPMQDDSSRWDRAVGERLAKLRTMPVDATRLQQRLRAQLAPTESVHPAVPGPRSWWRQPLRAAAAVAAILLIALLVLFMTSGGPVLASPAEMARMHQELISGRIPVTQVDSIEAANRQIISQWPASPTMPVPQENVMACCMKSVKNKRVACVLLKGQDAPITMTVANAADMKAPASPAVMRDGVAYFLQSAGAVNMVSTQRGERWLCLIAELPAERLMDVAARLSS